MNPRCCSIEDRGTAVTDSMGVITLPESVARRDFSSVELTSGDTEIAALILQRGRLVAIQIGRRELSGRRLDPYLVGATSDSGRLTIALDR